MTRQVVRVWRDEVAIRTKPGMLEHMVGPSSGSCAVQIQRAADRTAVVRALAQVEADLYATPHPDEPGGTAPNSVSVDAIAAGGPVIWFDMHDLDELMPTVLRYVRRRLRDAGVTDALIAWPDDGLPGERYAQRQRWSADVPGQSHGYFRVVRGKLRPAEGLKNRIPNQSTPRAAMLRVYPAMPPPTPGVRPNVELPYSWLQAAADWVSVGARKTDLLWASGQSLGDQFRRAPTKGLRYLVNQSRDNFAHLVAGDIDKQVRCCHCYHGWHPSLCLAAGGPEATGEDLADYARALVEVVRSLGTSVAYALVSVRQNFGAYSQTPAFWDPNDLGSLARDRLPVDAVTNGGRAFDAFYYQILGPSHLELLGVLPETLHSLPGGRAELFIGEPHDWLPENPDRVGIHEEARRQLAGCLPESAEVEALLAEFVRVIYDRHD